MTLIIAFSCIYFFLSVNVFSAENTEDSVFQGLDGFSHHSAQHESGDLLHARSPLVVAGPAAMKSSMLFLRVALSFFIGLSSGYCAFFFGSQSSKDESSPSKGDDIRREEPCKDSKKIEEHSDFVDVIKHWEYIIAYIDGSHTYVVSDFDEYEIEKELQRKSKDELIKHLEKRIRYLKRLLRHGLLRDETRAWGALLSNISQLNDKCSCKHDLLELLKDDINLPLKSYKELKKELQIRKEYVEKIIGSLGRIIKNNLTDERA